VNLAEVRGELDVLLPAHLQRQRWYGAKDRIGVELRITDIEELQPPWPSLLRVVVEVRAPAVGDGHAPVERYQLLLGLRLAASVEADAGLDPSAAVGIFETTDGTVSCFDGLADPELGLALLHHVAPAQEATSVRPINAEQSNTSLVYDERVILKVFRRLSGSNPEIEVTLGLAQLGFPNIAEPVAVWRTSGDDLAVLQRFLAGGVEGWALALTSVRDVLDEAVDPSEAGGDLAPEAERLGVMTAELHEAMAGAFGAEPADAGQWADAMAARLASVRHPDLDRAAVRAAIERVRSAREAGSSIRVHGDYHLGQVLRIDDGWYVLDFEGEPSRPVEERRQPSSPLRDVAGMLRSLSYAAAVGLREHGTWAEGARDLELVAGLSGTVESQPGRRPVELAAAWEQRNRNAFLTAYLQRLDGSPLLPADPESLLALLDAFELDKAVYELAYEQAHRPDWVQIPLDAVRRLADRQA
jgi:maltokinase